MGRYVKINGVLVPIAGIGGQDTNYKGETMSDWEALTQEEKDQYDTVDLTGDYYDVLDELDAMADQIVAVNEELSDVNNILGAKNLCPNNASSRTINGVTFTVNADGSVAVNGTPSGDIALEFKGTFILPKGTYKVTSGQRQELNSEIFVFVRTINPDAPIARSNSVDYPSIFTLENDTEVRAGIFRFYNSSSEPIALTIYPMIRPASIKDNTFVPYAMTNRELTQKTSIGVFNTNASATYTSSLYAGDTHYFADAGTTLPAGNYIFFVNSYYTTEVYWQRTVVVPQGGTALMRAGTRREDNGKTSWPASYSFYHSSNVPFTICPASYDAVTTGSASLKVYQYTLCWIKVTN